MRQLTKAEACRELAVSLSTLDRRIASGDIEDSIRILTEVDVFDQLRGLQTPEALWRPSTFSRSPLSPDQTGAA